MTRQRAFKRLIRERMARTGEHYAAARRHFFPDGVASTGVERAQVGGYEMRGGLHPETASLASVLADAGVTSPADERPYSEAMVLGLGGGLGAGYILWEFAAPRPAGRDARLPHRLAIPRALDRADRGPPRRPPLGRQDHGRDRGDTGDGRGLRGRAPPDRLGRRDGARHVAACPSRCQGYWGYPVVLIERSGDDPEVVLVDERGEEPMRVSVGRLATARGRIGSYKHMQFTVAEAEPLTLDGLRSAVREAVAECADHLAKPSDSFSLPAWRKWARMLTDRKNAKGWPRVFADGSGLFGALVSVTEEIDGGIGASGGHLRGLYADFLTEAAALLGDEPPRRRRRTLAGGGRPLGGSLGRGRAAGPA